MGSCLYNVVKKRAGYREKLMLARSPKMNTEC